MFRHILAAFDGSEHSKSALRYALGLAEAFGSKLLIVHAYPHTSDLLGYTDFERLVSRRKGAGETVLGTARHILEGWQVPVTEDLLEGPEAEAILAAAEVQGVDLIVMGSRGLGALQNMVFGSVSRKVSHQARCPVMLVRAE